MGSLAYAAVWLFAFTLPWQSTVVVIPGVGFISKSTGLLAAAAAVVIAVVNARVRRWRLFHVAGLLFLLWLVILLLVLHNGAGDLPNTFWTFVQLFLVLWIVWELAPTWERATGLLMAYVLGSHVAALETIMTFRRLRDATRYTAGGVDANDLAMTLALALPMAWYLGVTYHRPLLKWVCRAYLPIGLLAIGLTGSRGGMIATIVALSIVPFTLTRLSGRQRSVALALILLGGALAVVYVPERVVERLAQVGAQVQGGSISGRGKIWKAGLTAFMARPVAGYGPGGFRGAVYPYLGMETQVAHNSYISVLVEDGLIGFLLYATMVGSVWLAVLRLPRLERRFALVLLATLATAMLPLSWESKKPVWFILATVMTLASAPRPWPAASPGPAPVPAPSARARRQAALRPRGGVRPELGR